MVRRGAIVQLFAVRKPLERNGIGRGCMRRSSTCDGIGPDTLTSSHKQAKEKDLRGEMELAMSGLGTPKL